MYICACVCGVVCVCVCVCAYVSLIVYVPVNIRFSEKRGFSNSIIRRGELPTYTNTMYTYTARATKYVRFYSTLTAKNAKLYEGEERFHYFPAIIVYDTKQSDRAVPALEIWGITLIVITRLSRVRSDSTW